MKIRNSRYHEDNEKYLKNIMAEMAFDNEEKRMIDIEKL